jgi:hypothetical protein
MLQDIEEPPTAEPAPPQNPRRNAVIENVTVCVQSADHIIQGITKTHDVIPQNYLEKLQNKGIQIDTLQQSVRKKKYTGSPLSKCLLASMLISVPVISLMGAQFVISLVVAAFLADSHLIDDKLDLKLFSKSFASADNLHDILILYAVDSLIEVEKTRFVEQIMISYHVIRNKKGLSHFIKILSYWDKHGRRLKHSFLILMRVKAHQKDVLRQSNIQ